MDGERGMGGVYNPPNLNLYAYTHNNPVNLVDPDGNSRRPPNRIGNSPSSNSIVHSARVQGIQNRIRRYDPNYTYSNVSPINGPRYTHRDVTFIERDLKRYQREIGNRISYNLNPGGLNTINYYRNSLNIGRTKNIAYANVRIGGARGTYVAASGEHQHPGTIPNPVNRRFGTFPTNPNSKNTRRFDSEVKLLE
ncbi:hypothetical protein [Psychrobacter sp. I-STPA10]|uniref:hypothetical protein n=1 Tax=Psychrobacter sp. I-STPA10 TaxID=2585769 RepID=UPI001E422EFC|nr:hypothetical protein [Psychrobacter sp. I-STPA10]